MSLENTHSKHYFEKKSLLSEDFLFVVSGKIEESVSNWSCELSRGLSSILSVDGGDNLMVSEGGSLAGGPPNNVFIISPRSVHSARRKVDLIIRGRLKSSCHCLSFLKVSNPVQSNKCRGSDPRKKMIPSILQPIKPAVLSVVIILLVRLDTVTGDYRHNRWAECENDPLHHRLHSLSDHLVFFVLWRPRRGVRDVNIYRCDH